MSDKKNGEVNLIVSEPVGNSATLDRSGGQQQGIIKSLAQGLAKCHKVAGDRVTEGLREALGQFTESVSEALPKSVAGWMDCGRGDPVASGHR